MRFFAVVALALALLGCGGGADQAVELDAKRAIKQGTELALAMGS